MKNVKIPLKLKSSTSKENLVDGNGLITIKKSLSIANNKNAYVEVLFDGEKKIVEANLFGVSGYDSSADIISTTPDTIDSPYDECENKPSDLGVLLCIADRLSDAILSWF